jgi:hypothetical protein
MIDRCQGVLKVALGTDVAPSFEYGSDATLFIEQWGSRQLDIMFLAFRIAKSPHFGKARSSGKCLPTRAWVARIAAWAFTKGAQVTARTAEDVVAALTELLK